MEQPSIVRFSHVALSYPSGGQIFSDVSFRLTPGSFTFLTGASGSGKTSILKMIYMALQQTQGDVVLFGQNTKTIAPNDVPIIRRRIGMILQDLQLVPHLTVFENVALPLYVRGLPLSDYRKDIMELLDWVGLAHRTEAMPAVLSGGELQRVAIARAVITRPDLIIADEPTGSVDPEMAERIMRLLVELNKLGATLLIATHDQLMIERFPNNMLKISDHKLWGVPYQSYRKKENPALSEEVSLNPALKEEAGEEKEALTHELNQIDQDRHYYGVQP